MSDFFHSVFGPQELPDGPSPDVGEPQPVATHSMKIEMVLKDPHSGLFFMTPQFKLSGFEGVIVEPEMLDRMAQIMRARIAEHIAPPAAITETKSEHRYYESFAPNERERLAIVAFFEKHRHEDVNRGAAGGGYEIAFRPNAIGCGVIARCDICREQENVTDVSGW